MRQHVDCRYNCSENHGMITDILNQPSFYIHKSKDIFIQLIHVINFIWHALKLDIEMDSLENKLY